jgi:hypothetical protein
MCRAQKSVSGRKELFLFSFLPGLIPVGTQTKSTDKKHKISMKMYENCFCYDKVHHAFDELKYYEI